MYEWAWVAGLFKEVHFEAAIVFLDVTSCFFYLFVATLEQGINISFV